MVLTHTVIEQGEEAALLHYQVWGTLLQCLWIPAVWGLLHALDVRHSVVALCLGGAAGCGSISVELVLFGRCYWLRPLCFRVPRC